MTLGEGKETGKMITHHASYTEDCWKPSQYNRSLEEPPNYMSQNR